MSHYAVRLTKSYEDCSGAILRIANVVERLIVYEHEASRTHVHMLLDNCSVSTDTLKNYIKKELGVINSRDWSFKTAQKSVMSYANYIKYMYKGTNKPKYNKGFKEEEIAFAESLWIPVNANANDNVIVSKKRQTEYDIQIMIEDELWPGPRTPEACEAVSKDDIYNATIKVLEREHKFAYYQRVSRLCQAIRIRFHPADAKNIVMKMF